MSRPPLLAEFEGKLRTSVGGCFPGERAVFRGRDLHTDLKDASWFDLYLFGITGRRFSAAQLRLLETIWTYTSYPDARLWNNRVAALAGSAGSTANLGLAAAIAVSEAALYGRQVDIAVADFFVRARRKIEKGEALETTIDEELRLNRGIGGYGRPVARASADERNGPILKVAEELGLAGGDYVKLAFAVERILAGRRLRMRMNFAGLAAALALDAGLDPTEYYLFVIPAFVAGMPPCYIDAAERPRGATLPMRCEAVAYTGPPVRTWAGRSARVDDLPSHMEPSNCSMGRKP